MSDIVERLRLMGTHYGGSGADVADDAAAEIERLRKQKTDLLESNKILRSKLEVMMGVSRIQARMLGNVPLEENDEAFFAGAAERLQQMRAALSGSGDSAAGGSPDKVAGDEP